MSINEGEYPDQFLGLDTLTDANAGAVNIANAPVKLNTGSLLAKASTAGAILSSGTGVPSIGGNVGDLYIRIDGAETTYFYRCTVAGAANVATWVAMSGA